MSPCFRVDRRGVEPRLPGCKPSVFPLDQRPLLRELRPGLDPGLPPYRGGVLPKHLQTDRAKVIPDGVEPSFPGCRPGVVAVGPRGCFQVESPGVAPGSPACGAGVVLLDHDPMIDSAEAVGLEPTSGQRAAACFPSRFLSQFG